jgi:hypothetical protein
MRDKSIVYCDESGNDGPNYLNPQQPFYVLAGWAVPSDRIVEATVAIERTRQRECRDAPALKFKTFKKSERKRAALIDLICELAALGLIPIFLFAEKRYCVAGKIVETFLDPYYNPLVRNGLTWDVQTKQELANTLCESLPEATRRKFAEAYKDPTASGLTAALSEIIEESRDRINPELGKFLDGSRVQMPAIVDAEIIAAKSYEKAGGTLNFPCLVSYLMLLEDLARKKLIDPHRLVHDEQGPYQAGYEQVFLEHRHAADHWIKLIGQDTPYGALRAVRSFEVQNDVKQPMLQAADLLAGTINQLCTKLQTDTDLTSAEQRLAKLTLPAMLSSNPRLAWPLCSDRMLKQIGALFRKLFPSDSSTSTEHSVSEQPLLLPVFPVAKFSDDGAKRFPIVLPLFGIVRESDGALMIALPPGRAYSETDRQERLVLLHTNRETAQRFLDDEQPGWTEPHTVREFDVPNLPELLEQLGAWSEIAAYVVLDPFCEVTGRIEIQDFINGMRRIIDRTTRAIRGGAIDILLNSHSLGGCDAISILSSSGRYAAAWKDDHSRVYTGKTREAALESLAASASPLTSLRPLDGN